ncbi:hypothetical protein GTP46_25865 [Duganella sp. FT135W]|uniref:Uncharacterized protein n=1 Tax=Duganella flavida TaxID=2692175 RepID=A0A6L8KN89_9BURK|nr:hypothetical protein [Duganella flavida]MYM26061.1 hypothetical protein [Duganella flavida]
MRRLSTIFGAVILASVSQVSAQLQEESSGQVIAEAVAKLARIDQEVDIRAIEQELKLPNLNEQIIWQGPFSAHSSPRFFAYYDPPASELGIKKVVIHWSLEQSPPNKPKILNVLNLELASMSCPTTTSLEAALGSKPIEFSVPGHDGGPSYNTTSFTVPQRNGDPVFVSFGIDTCQISISHTRDL